MAEIKRCPACENLVRPDEEDQWPTYCPLCDSALSGVSPQPEEQPSDPMAAADDEIPATAGTCTCGAPLTQGESCIYCGRNIDCGSTVDSPAPQSGDTSLFILQWPWGDESITIARVFIGRIPPVSPVLAEQLERDYPNVSRLHAEIFQEGGRLFVRDYASTNGTFVNDRRIEPHAATLVQHDDNVRFAASLCAVLRQEQGGRK